MSIALKAVASYDSGSHHFRVVTPQDPESFLQAVAKEYNRLRTETALPLTEVQLDGIQVLDVAGLKAKLAAACIPQRTGTTFDVTRSDFGETIAYMLLEKEYETRFGYRSIRDRELVNLPGRGIDLVGVETGPVLTLVLGETKVSGENVSPPQVVEKSEDSLHRQHRFHLTERKATYNKLFDLARHVRDEDIRNYLFAAALLFEKEEWSRLQLISYCVLVRPHSCHKKADFGKFIKKPEVFDPSQIRFWIVCMPDDIDSTIDAWHKHCTSAMEAA
ncbi:hypothetical protein JQX13_19800 [Archangium violaceum]|uniref:hypothetical protein n=1 Tax=Archangium violaceum TaxID=83451 RepID=UPI00193C534D|nr:hypothetical protein [Archangium violaceum]QRK12089.1 hypothetical protein JQX13_19800 [Archangium violaceum]